MHRNHFVFGLLAGPALLLVVLAAAPASRALGEEEPAPELPMDIPVILAPHQRAVLSAEVASSVVAIGRELGQPFEKGEMLVQLDATIYEANRDKAAAQVASAKAQLQSKQNLLVDGSASVTEVETARMNLAVARANLIVARKELASCSVVAPFPGRVVEVLVNRHEVVQPGQELIRVVDDSVLRAQFLVPSTLLGELSIGRPVTVEVHETGQQVAGRISHIGGDVDAASSTVKVYAEIPNDAGELRGGMRGSLAFAPAQP
jgi:RND family efflux transporter MFP subunit